MTLPHVRFGITEDTGGHIAYVLGAARAQAARTEVDRVDVVTRAFYAPELGADHMVLEQMAGPKLILRRLATADRRYLAKEALAAEVPAMTDAFDAMIARLPRRPDVIHAHFADAARIARPAAARFGIPIVYTPHSLGIDKKRLPSDTARPALDRRIAEERAALERSDAVVVSSRDEAERQVEGYGADVAGRVHRVSPGVTPVETPEGTGRARALVDPILSAPQKPMILAVARPVARKNLAGLLRAYAADATLRERANLVILAGQRGPGTEGNAECASVLEELRDLAAAPGLAGRVALPPDHAPEDVPQLYRLAAERRGVFVNPAFHEPFGLTILEAAQAGLPVVATREGGPSDILDRIGHGLLVDPTDGPAIAAAISDLLSDAVAWRAASEAGLTRIGLYGWDAWAGRVLRIYRQARSGAAPRGFARRRLLACDIDGTLTGCRAAAARFRDWAEGARDVPFLVATGRCITEARAVLAAWDLPEPDMFVTAVGTELHRPGPDGRLMLCPDYAASMSRGWDRDAALHLLRASGLRLQPDVEQRRWKLSAFGTETDAVRLLARFRAEGVAARVIASHGRLIDVLAPEGGKAAAVEAAAGQFGLTLDDCIVAGDSGNDHDMLRAAGMAILVGNALPEVAGMRAAPNLYRARASHAAGVIEGLAAAGLLDSAARIEAAE